MNFDRADRRMREVHEANLAAANAANMTLEQWHEMMSERGRGTEPVLLTKKKQPEKQKYVPQTATEQVLSYIFPSAHNDQ